MEVSEKGDIANWKVPGKMVKGMGGAMDLVASAKNIIVAMQHTDKQGNSKLLPQCSLPITGIGCVKKIVSDLGVFDVTPEGFVCIEHAPGVSLDEIRSKTAGRLRISEQVKEMIVD
jgi:3-oxoacid CoA-transferase subunit B